MKRIWSITVLILTGAAAVYSQTPAVVDGGVLNGASFAKGQAVAPGSLVSVFGTNLVSTQAHLSSVPVSTTLADVSVTFDGIPAPMYDTIPLAAVPNIDQINVQLPWNLPTSGTVNVVVTRTGMPPSSPVAIPVTPSAPGIFFTSGFQAIAFGNSDGALAAPVGAFPGLTTHPAKIGDPTTLVIFATGLGPVDATVRTGDVPDVLVTHTLTTPTVLVGGVAAQVGFSGLVGRDSNGVRQGFVGVYQINIVIQPGTPTGPAVPLQLQMNGITSTNQVTIAVSN